MMGLLVDRLCLCAVNGMSGSVCRLVTTWLVSQYHNNKDQVTHKLTGQVCLDKTSLRNIEVQKNNYNLTMKLFSFLRKKRC